MLLLEMNFMFRRCMLYHLAFSMSTRKSILHLLVSGMHERLALIVSTIMVQP